MCGVDRLLLVVNPSEQQLRIPVHEAGYANECSAMGTRRFCNAKRRCHELALRMVWNGPFSHGVQGAASLSQRFALPVVAGEVELLAKKEV